MYGERSKEVNKLKKIHALRQTSMALGEILLMTKGY